MGRRDSEALPPFVLIAIFSLSAEYDFDLFNVSPPPPPPPLNNADDSIDLTGESSSFYNLKLQVSHQFLVYGLIGIVNTAVHAVVFFSLVALGAAQSVGNLIAFSVAVMVSFFANARFTFKQRPTVAKFLKMTVVMALLSLASGAAGDALAVHPVITFIVYCAVSYVAGFLLSRFFVFAS